MGTRSVADPAKEGSSCKFYCNGENIGRKEKPELLSLILTREGGFVHLLWSAHAAILPIWLKEFKYARYSYNTKPGKYDGLWVVRTSIKSKETWNGMKYQDSFYHVSICQLNTETNLPKP